MNGFLSLLAVLAIVGYPIHGAIMYGDPWAWILKKELKHDTKYIQGKRNPAVHR